MSRAAWRLLAAELARQRRGLLRLGGWSLLEMLPVLLSGHLVALATDRGFLAGRPGIGLAWLGAFAAAYLVGAVGTRHTFGALGVVVEGVRDAIVRTTVAATLRRAADGAGRAGGAEAAGASGVARLGRQVESVRDLLAGLLMSSRRFVLTLVAALVGLLALAPVLLLLIAVPLAVSLLLFGLLALALVPRQRAQLLADERVAELAGTAVGAVRDAVACGGQQRLYGEVAPAIDAQAAAARAVARTGSLRTLVIAVGGPVPLLLVLLAAPWLRERGLSAGEVLGAVTYLSISLEPALRAFVQSVGSSGLHLLVTLDRLAAAARLPAPPPAPAAGEPAGHLLRLESVTFAYGRHAAPVVRELSLAVPHGEHLAVVGPSGIGKSTLAGLLAGVLSPQRGRVTIGGVPVERTDPGWRHRAVALIPQEAYVFAGTVRENLAYLASGVADPALDAAVDLLGLRAVVERIGGYDAQFAPDSLSAGERQLVALARAYLSPAEVVILDEATCHLDPVAEARVEEAFAARPWTLVVIAHRISSARRADRIVLMDGAEAAVGSHADLLARSPGYADLVGQWDWRTAGAAVRADRVRGVSGR